MKKVLCVLFHILGYPLLLAGVLYANWNIIMTQTKNYGVFVFVGAIITVLMAIIYYICYLAITAKRKKKRKTIFNQTVRLCLVIVITTSILWGVCDVALPDLLANATSSTLYYEDLADGWKDRADVNEELLDKFIEMSVKAGTLPYDEEEKTLDEAIEYYQNLGYKESVSELSGNEYYDSVSGLFAIQFQSMDSMGYSAFTHPWIDFATSDRLTIPCLVHLLLDEREINADKITNKDYTEYTENENGEIEYTGVFFAVCDKATNTITVKSGNANWTVLDMLGTDTVISLNDVSQMVNMGLLKNILSSSDLGVALKKTCVSLAEILSAERILNGGEINLILETGPLVEEDSVKITLRPTTGYYYGEEYEKTEFHKGLLGYQEMAWLNSNGLIYALVTLFSTRKIFLIFGAWGVMMNIFIGLCRGMCKEEKEKKRRIDAIRAPEKPNKIPTYGIMR